MYVSQGIKSPTFQTSSNISVYDIDHLYFRPVATYLYMIQIYLFLYIHVHMTCRQPCRNQGLILLLPNLMLLISSAVFYMGEVEERFKPFQQFLRFQPYILIDQESLTTQPASHWDHQEVETLNHWMQNQWILTPRKI